MALQLLPVLSASEIPTLALLHLKAFMLVRVNQAMYPKGITPPIISATESRHTNSFLHDPTAHYVKVVDLDLDGGQIIAFAEWHVFSTVEEEASRTDLGPKTWPKDVDLSLASEFWAHIINARKSMAGIPHVFLSIIATEPGHGRRGAAAMLMEYGMKLADERNLPCFLESSPFGEGLYSKFGYREKKELSFDVDLPGDGPEVDRYRHLVMLRPKREETKGV